MITFGSFFRDPPDPAMEPARGWIRRHLPKTRRDRDVSVRKQQRGVSGATSVWKACRAENRLARAVAATRVPPSLPREASARGGRPSVAMRLASSTKLSGQIRGELAGGVVASDLPGI